MLLLAVAAAATAEEAPPLPPPGFLEFLGAMVEADGELIDPMALESDLERVLAEEVRTASWQTGSQGSAADGQDEGAGVNGSEVQQ